MWRHAAAAAAAALATSEAHERYLSNQDLEVWEPVPFRRRPAPPSGESLEERRLRLRDRKHAVEAKQKWVEESELIMLEAGLQAQDWMAELDNRSRALALQKETFKSAWANQEVALLHLMVFRLVQIQAVAAVSTEGSIDTSADAEQVAALHKTGKEQSYLWDKVEVLACMQGHLEAVTGDFPVHSVLRTSTSLPVTNICDEETLDPSVKNSPDVSLLLLKQLARFINFASDVRRGEPPRLYLILLETNVLFNELPGVLHGRDGASRASVAVKAAEASVARRYAELLREEGHSAGSAPGVVVGTDHLCRRGLYGACTPEEAEQAPAPFLHASGLVAPLAALEPLVSGLLALAGASEDLSSLLRRYAAREHPEVSIVPDRRQRIFGSLSESTPGACRKDSSSSQSWCLRAEPCCPISSEFKQLHEAFYGRYLVKDCSLQRRGDADMQPLLWVGDGIAKWMYLLALDGLATSCTYIARLVLLNHPVDLLDKLFTAFEETQLPGAIAPRTLKGVPLA